MPKLVIYTVRYKHYVDKNKVQQDEMVFDSPTTALEYVQKLLEDVHLLTYRIFREEEINMRELEGEVLEAAVIIKKD